MPSPIQRELSNHEYIRDQLLKQFPEETAESLADTLEGETDLQEMLARVLRSALDDKAMAAGLKERFKEMQERQSRFYTAEAKKRALVMEVMERAGIKKLTDPEFTASLRAAPAPVVITDEDLLPPALWKQPDPVLDRTRLRQELQAGRNISGAVLGNPPMTLSVRTK